MVMELWNKLFRKNPTAEDIRVQLKEVERDQKKKRREMDLSEQAKQAKLKEAIKAKKDGKAELQRDIFRELRQTEIDRGHLNTELRRLSLSKTALTRFIRQMEMLGRRKDRSSLQNLIMRFRDSEIQRAIDKAEVDDDTFNDMLEEILGEEELAVAGGTSKEDAGFAEFDAALTKMMQAEETGSEEAVAESQAEVDRAVRAALPDRTADSER